MATLIRDAIWGDIELAERELALIDTAPFQRLRRVRQLGFTDLIYPGANHTRFEHSLGVLHLARQAARRLGVDSPALEAAALLHDIGHYPYSHAVEELERSEIRHHEQIAVDTITTDPVAAVLRQRWSLEPSEVAALIVGEPTWLKTVLDSGLDVDKLDYLVRDARGANVPYGVVDVQRLIGSLVVADGRLAVTAKGVAALESLVFAKHLMFSTVYWHHACRSATVMLLRAVQGALDAASITPPQLEASDDAELLAALAHGPELTQVLAARLRARRLYKRVAEIRPDDELFAPLEALWFDPARRRALEDRWARDAGLAAGAILLDVPEPRPIGVELPVLIDGELVAWDQAADLPGSDLDRLQRGARKIRVFASDRLAGWKVVLHELE